jgi:acetylornithine deacetylase
VIVAAQTLRDVLEESTAETRDFLVGAIRFPTTHGNEAEAQAYVKRQWEDAGFEVEEHPIPNSIRTDPEYAAPQTDRDFDGRPNLVVRLAGEEDGRSVIINSHVDVVPAGDWPDAYVPRIEGDAVFGRGACDAKGALAAMYLAARAMRRLGVPRAGQVVWQIVIDEEIGGNGTLALIREGMRADGAVVLEPTGLAMHPANRGALWFRFEFRGESRHTGRKHLGVNAIDLAREAIGILYEYEKELIEDRQRQPLFAHYEHPAQLNVGMLHGGDFPSTVAASAVLEGVAGFLPCRPMEQVEQDLVRYIDRLGSDALKSRYVLSFPKLHNEAYETPVEDPFVQTFHRATRETAAREDITGWNVSCDARLFATLAGMPTVVFGPGLVDDAHSAREQIRMSEIVTAAETLVRFVERWCSGGADDAEGET